MCVGGMVKGRGVILSGSGSGSGLVAALLAGHEEGWKDVPL